MAICSFAAHSKSLAGNTSRRLSGVVVVTLCVGLIAFTSRSEAQTVAGNLATGNRPRATAVNPVTNTLTSPTLVAIP